MYDSLTELANAGFSLTFRQLVRSDGDKAELITAVPHLTAQELEEALLPQLMPRKLAFAAPRLFTVKFMDTEQKFS